MPVVKLSLGDAAKHYAKTGNVTAEKILDGYHLHSEEEDLSTMCSYPGARDFLFKVICLGGNNYLYTHRGESVFKAIKKENFDELFIDMVTSLDGFPPKPAPDALLYLIRKHSLDPKECVMVGDRMIDLNAGLYAGMNAICMDPDGFCIPSESIPVFRDYKTLSGYIQEK